jgi:NADH:ubiquinone oxidoreductase subunit C
MSLPADFIVLCRDRLGIEEVPEDGPVVQADQMLDFARALKDELDFRFFVTVVSVHYPAVEPVLAVEAVQGVEADEEAGITAVKAVKGVEAVPGTPDRTDVMYRVRRLNNAERPTSVAAFHISVPTGQTTPSLAGVWVGADWQEREQYDLVGTVFAGHPDLRRIMMPEDWKGHPLRRDYAIDTSHFPWR